MVLAFAGTPLARARVGSRYVTANVVWWSRFRGSVPDLDNLAYPAIATALIANSCTWTCARAAAALKAQDS